MWVFRSLLLDGGGAMNQITHQTRREARESVDASQNRIKVLGVILTAKVPIGASQIAEELCWDVTSVRPRCTELLKCGQIHATGKHKLPSGRSEACFEAVPIHSFESPDGQGFFALSL